MRFKSLWWVGLLLWPLSSWAELEITDPWAPEAPPGRTMAGFMVLANTGEEAIVLVDGQSPQFDRIEIHDMVVDQGVMRMRKLDQLRIEPGAEVVLQSGSFHVMLMEPNTTLTAGDLIELVLFDEQGTAFPVTLTVRQR